jgi:hypothetical protein
MALSTIRRAHSPSVRQYQGMRFSVLLSLFSGALVACGSSSEGRGAPTQLSAAPPTPPQPGDTSKPPDVAPPQATCPTGDTFTTDAGKIIVKGTLDTGVAGALSEVFRARLRRMSSVRRITHTPLLRSLALRAAFAALARPDRVVLRQNVRV